MSVANANLPVLSTVLSRAGTQGIQNDFYHFYVQQRGSLSTEDQLPTLNIFGTRCPLSDNVFERLGT